MWEEALEAYRETQWRFKDEYRVVGEGGAMPPISAVGYHGLPQAKVIDWRARDELVQVCVCVCLCVCVYVCVCVCGTCEEEFCRKLQRYP